MILAGSNWIHAAGTNYPCGLVASTANAWVFWATRHRSSSSIVCVSILLLSKMTTEGLMGPSYEFFHNLLAIQGIQRYLSCSAWELRWHFQPIGGSSIIWSLGQGLCVFPMSMSISKMVCVFCLHRDASCMNVHMHICICLLRVCIRMHKGMCSCIHWRYVRVWSCPVCPGIITHLV